MNTDAGALFLGMFLGACTLAILYAFYQVARISWELHEDKKRAIREEERKKFIEELAKEIRK